MGSRHAFLGDLWAHLVARTNTVKPVLQRIVEAWLTHFPRETQNSVSQQSASLAEEIRAVRREIAVARHQRREARRQRKELWTPTLSSNTASTNGSQQFAAERPCTSSQLSYASREDDPFADADGGNQPWQDDVSGFYKHMASENGNAYAFDRASVHPAFDSPNVQPCAFQPQAFATGVEFDSSDREAIWEGADSNGAMQTLTSPQLAIPSSSTGPAQEPPSDSLPPAMLQDESRASNRFRNIATSSVFSNHEPAQPVPLRPEVPLSPQPYTGYGNVAAPSSFYTDTGPARPHPPRTDVSLAAARPPSAPSSDLARRDHSHRLRPDASDQPPAGFPYHPRPVPPGHPHRPATHEEALRGGEQDEIVERPTFTEHYENKRKPKPLPPSGRRQFYGRRPSPPPLPSPPPHHIRPLTSRPQPGSPPVPEAPPALTPEEVRRWLRARGPVAPSDVSTVWPQDSISSVGLPR
ncbi:uncharacterized protein LY79DRAFT_522563 [Colletotrichum navitas]|uniref:Uncharacterized protein n=1 Tax=Colletotrichum navitas TaxID=681940 RepID=A0AAD8UZM4_9PEZI|nr:uncharacterized protein LY79DRAFT_522563 [Colletotrichum navitas]KAK1579425.1 hypothetical protein LY79DRAFT_522563 [Colletotrichum navitas]